MMTTLRRVVLLMFAAFSLTPLLWVLLTAFKARFDITTARPTVFFAPTLANFRALVSDHDLGRLLANSVIVATTSTLICIAMAAVTAYSLVHEHSSRTRMNVLVFLLTTRLTPVVALSLPIFVVFTRLGLRGTLIGIATAHTIANLPIAVWLLSDSFRRVPSEISYAARLDGLSEGALFGRIILPVTRSSIAATALLCFLFSWNEYALSTLLSTHTTATLSGELPVLITQGVTQWGQLCAGMTVLMVPAIAVAMIGGRAVLRHQFAGALKKN